MMVAVVGSGEAINTECWPDNWIPYCAFSKLDTQWSRESGRRTGIRYEAIQSVLELDAVGKKERARIFNDLIVMEREALELLNKS